MKLYTEEQVKRAMLEYTSYSKPTMVQVIDTLKPIELPSDRDIEIAANGNQEHYEGAMWLKYKILNQNK